MAELNGVMMQFFHWYSPSDGGHWRRVGVRAAELAAAGFTALWLPPASKGFGGQWDVGYGVYDLFDLGEFDQKGSVRTKYGTRDEYLAAIRALQKTGIQIYGDAVLNHRIGGDFAETAKATPFGRNDRLNPTGSQRDVRVYTHFAFPGRQGKYSTFEWHWWHFDAVDYDDYSREKDAIYLFDGKIFDSDVALQYGNYGFLMGCDLDFQNDWVRGELTYWGKWYLDTTGVDGFRIDALKHIAAWFFPNWLDEMERHAGKDLFVVGEYWSPEIQPLHWYLDAMGQRMAVFDVPLHYNFHVASRSGGHYDMRRILDGTLMRERPTQAVTFVENHDSQPLQALESPVESWFKPLAYALILLRREGYPCIFQADYDGAEYEDYGKDGNRYRIALPTLRPILDTLLCARRNYAYGPQYDYFDHENTIGWTRLGDDHHPGGLAVLMSDGPAGWKWMEVGQPCRRFVDLTGQVPEPVWTNEYGWGEFRCQGGSVSVWAGN